MATDKLFEYRSAIVRMPCSGSASICLYDSMDSSGDMPSHLKTTMVNILYIDFCNESGFIDLF